LTQTKHYKMKKIVVSAALLIGGVSVQAQCGSVDKGMRSILTNKISEAEESFTAAGNEIKEAESKDQPMEAKCYAKYYYGSGHVALQNYLNNEPKDLVSKVAMLDKAEGYFAEFFTLAYEDKSFKARAITDLESVANQQKNVAVDYFNEGDFETALRLLEKAIQNKAKLGVNHLDLHAYQSASITANRLGEYQKAIQYNDVLIKNPQLLI